MFIPTEESEPVLEMLMFGIKKTAKVSELTLVLACIALASTKKVASWFGAYPIFQDKHLKIHLSRSNKNWGFYY